MSFPSASREPGRSSGFSLVEVLIALVLLGVALLLGVELVLENPRVVGRLDGERQAFRAMESTMEAVRAGVIELRTGDLTGLIPDVGTPVPRNLSMFMQVDPTATPGLFQVTLTTRYTVFNFPHIKQLQTMVWTPN
ncbi:MAG TPA: prepilin-type N-terminal cleavage/methylation domain-containing protein [Thermoanaerobaculia bacterium]|jgi:prepilin-type N-terminal cleavage/methylation domain-containing protein